MTKDSEPVNAKKGRLSVGFLKSL